VLGILATSFRVAICLHLSLVKLGVISRTVKAFLAAVFTFALLYAPFRRKKINIAMLAPP
jgi:hypothetical protein